MIGGKKSGGDEMLTQDQARAEAQRHLDADPFPHADYRWAPPEGRARSNGWYFDYKFEHVAGLPQEQWEGGFGGAPGFLVDKETGKVHIVSWAELSRLEAPDTSSK